MRKSHRRDLRAVRGGLFRLEVYFSHGSRPNQIDGYVAQQGGGFGSDGFKLLLLQRVREPLGGIRAQDAAGRGLHLDLEYSLLRRSRGVASALAPFFSGHFVLFRHCDHLLRVLF